MRRLNRGGVLVVLTVLGLIAAACGGQAGPPEACTTDSFGCVEVGAGEPIKVGSLLVITTADASLGLDSQYGVELALDYWGATEFDQTNGQIKGHDLQLVAEDDGCSAEGGTAGAQKLASDTDIAAVIGTSCSSAALGVADKILGDKGIVLVSPSNTGPALTEPATHHPFYLRTAHNDKIQGAAVANFAFNELGVKSAATIHDGSPYADGLQQVFADTFTALGGTITVQEAIQRGDTDFNPVLTSIAATNPELLYYPIFVAEGALITQQARQVEGLTAILLAVSDGQFTPAWIDAAGAENTENVYVSGPDLSAFSGDVDFYNSQFLTAYKERYAVDEPLSVFHAHAWDATNIVLAAIDKVAIESGDTLYIPRTALKDALFQTAEFKGITGILTCNENGDCQQSATIAVHQVHDGDFGTPIYSELGSLEG